MFSSSNHSQEMGTANFFVSVNTLIIQRTHIPICGVGKPTSMVFPPKPYAGYAKSYSTFIET